MSRNIDDLVPELAELCKQHIAACKRKDIKLLVYYTKRTIEEQALLFAQGRKISELPKEVADTISVKIAEWKKQGLLYGPGKIVTWVYGDKSPHVRCRAYDCVCIINGVAIWDNYDIWNQIGYEGTQLGLEWGGNWPEGHKDLPHFQLKDE